MVRTPLVAGAAAVAVLAAGAGVVARQNGGLAAELDGRRYAAMELVQDGRARPVGAFLSFEGGTAAVEVGCLATEAPYRIRRGHLVLGAPLVGGLQGCGPGQPGPDEIVVRDVFATEPTIAAVTDLGLVLRGADVELRLVEVQDGILAQAPPAPPPVPTGAALARALAGRTFVDGAFGSTGGPAMSLHGYLRFRPEGLQVDIGCQEFRYAYAVQGRRIRIGPGGPRGEPTCGRQHSDGQAAETEAFLAAGPRVARLSDSQIELRGTGSGGYGRELSMTAVPRERLPVAGTPWALSSFALYRQEPGYPEPPSRVDEYAPTPVEGVLRVTAHEISGTVYCTDFRGAVRRLGDGVLEVGRLSVETRAVCPYAATGQGTPYPDVNGQDDLAGVAADVLGRLSGRLRYEVRAGELFLVGPDGRGLRWHDRSDPPPRSNFQQVHFGHSA
jgi:hypothetical protein